MNSRDQVLYKVYSVLSIEDKKSSIYLLFLMVIGMLLEGVGVGLVLPIVTVLMDNDAINKYPESVKSLLNDFSIVNQDTIIIYGMLLLVIVYVIKTFFSGFLAWKSINFSGEVSKSLSKRILKIYFSQEYSFHLQKNSAELVRNVQGQTAEFSHFGILAGLTLVSEFLVLVGLLIVMAIVELRAAVLVTILMGGASWLYISFMRKRNYRWGELLQYHNSKKMQHLLQGLGSIKEVKLLSREVEFIRQFFSHTSVAIDVQKKQNFSQSLPRLGIELLIIISMAIFIIALVILEYSSTKIVPIFLTFSAIALRVMPSVTRIVNAIQQLKFGLPMVDNLYVELGRPVNDKNSSASIKYNCNFDNQIELTNVDFKYYGADKHQLRNVSLKINNGDMVGVVGVSGSGKSTLVDILLGLLIPESGVVMVDGNDIQENMRWWQKQIGYVSQNIFLTDDTLRNNIAFGIPVEEIDDQSIWTAVDGAQLRDFVESLPDKLDSLVGENGCKLSGGQLQRIGIARALYHNPSVLVLDEATSALDVSTEQKIMSSIYDFHGDKTVIIIAHRYATVESCDIIYKIKEGAITYSGKPFPEMMGD